MTPEQKTIIEQAAEKKYPYIWPKNKHGEDMVQRVGEGAPYSQKFKKMQGAFAAGAQYVVENPSDFSLACYDTFKKEPVAALLVNALKYCTPEQLIALRNALNERTGDKLFGREEVVILLGEFGREASERGVANGFDEQAATEWLDNHLKK